MCAATHPCGHDDPFRITEPLDNDDGENTASVPRGTRCALINLLVRILSVIRMALS
jgi:hypothetical protein